MSVYSGQSYTAANTANVSYQENSTEVSRETLAQLVHFYKTKQFLKMRVLLKLNNITIAQALAAYNSREDEKRENKRTIIKDIVQIKKDKAAAQLAAANSPAPSINYTPVILFIGVISLVVYMFKKKKK